MHFFFRIYSAFKRYRMLRAGMVAMVLIIVAVIFRPTRTPATPVASETNDDGVTVRFTTPQDLDSDTDGLLDWEEQLWGTDPDNPDSDNDGTPDGEEVRLRRSPTVRGTEDQLAFLPQYQSLDPSLSQTQDISRQLLGEYFTGFTSDTSNAAAIVEPFVQGLQTENVEYTTYESETLTIVDTTQAARQTYAGDLTRIVTEHELILDEELLILGTFAAAEEEIDEAALTTIADRYTDTAKALATIPVPNEIEIVHLDLINGLSRIGSDLDLVKQVEEDALIAVVGINNYEASALQTQQAVAALNAYFTTYRIGFTAFG